VCKATFSQCKQQRTTQELELERQKVEHTRAMAEITHTNSLKKAEYEESIREQQIEMRRTTKVIF
jgi:hypothetical protein